MMRLGRQFTSRAKTQQIYELYLELLREKGQYRGCTGGFTGGTDTRGGVDDTAFYTEIVKTEQQAAKDLGYPGIVPTYGEMAPPSRENLEKVYESGVRVIDFNMEVWPEWAWPLVVPGKHKFVGRKVWMDRMLEAVEIFGTGHVGTTFVVGVEMAPAPYGHGHDGDIDKAVNESMEGYEWCIQNGIFLVLPVWGIHPGSLLYKLGATHPPLEFYCKIIRGHYQLMKKYLDDPNSAVAGHMWRCYKDSSPFCIHTDLTRLILPEMVSGEQKWMPDW